VRRARGAGHRLLDRPRNIAYGPDYGEAIVDGINESRVMVLVFSSHANTSPHIKREVDRAVSKDLTIIPIRIENVAPTRALEYYISPVHWLDAVAPPIEPHFHALGGKIRTLLGKGERMPAGDLAPEPARTAAPTPAQPATLLPPRPPAARAAGAAATSFPAPTPVEPRRFGRVSLVGGAVAALAAGALLWAQPWNPGDSAREAAQRAAQIEAQKREEARQAELAEQRKQDAAGQAELDAQRRRDAAQAEEIKRAAEEATRRADEATKRLEAARLAEEARGARALAEQRRQAEQVVPKPPPARNTTPVAALDPTAAKGQVEQKLRSRGLLKEGRNAQWGVTVDVTDGGVVTLTGVLQTNEQRNDTVRLAGEVPGITDVKQRINVQQSWTTR
jgi:osmotically-inducible protein OsmY